MHPSRLGGQSRSIRSGLPCRKTFVPAVRLSRLANRTFEPCVSPPKCLSAPSKSSSPVLHTRFKGHDASLTAALVLGDEPGCKKFVTASLDKTVVRWTLNEPCEGEAHQHLTHERYSPPGGPVFALSTPSSKDTAAQRLVYCGTAAKEILLWHLHSDTVSEKARLNSHTGWVRSLAISGKWLFSCGCNHLRQWDTTLAVPKAVSSTALFTGDILGIATGGGKVYTAGVDGSIRSWSITKQGELIEAGNRDKAHDGRVTAILWHQNILFSVSYDGDIKGWDGDTMDLVLQAKAGHDGKRIHCLALGPNGTLYTGGEDQLIRQWQPAVLEEKGVPVGGHDSPVRVLAAGARDCLISGDSNGEVILWSV